MSHLESPSHPAGCAWQNSHSACSRTLCADLRTTRSSVMVACMMAVFKVIAHLLSTCVRVALPGGARAVITESLLLKHQLPVLGRSRKKAPSLAPWDLLRCESIVLKSYWVMVVMDHFTRRIVGISVEPADIDGVVICRMFNQAISIGTLTCR
jgi:hypothetical protein